MYTYDLYGWYAGQGAGERSTDAVPPTLSMTTTPGEPRANWTGLQWITAQYVTPIIEPPAPPEAPISVTMRQARLALLAAGKLAAVTTAINALPEPAKSAAQIEWEYSNEVQRFNGFVEQLGPALGLSSAQLDALFIAAAAL